MTEVAFAQAFLATLDKRPARLTADHVEDPKTYPARPAYILPKMPRPMAKRQKLAPGQERSLKVSLKSLRNPPLDIVLKDRAPVTSVLDLKTEVSSQTSIPVDKIRLLYKKKPVGDAKVLKDLVEDEETSVEFTIMVMGGASAVKKEEEHAPVAVGPSGADVVDSPEFWNDLKGFLVQRLRSEEEGKIVYDTFKAAWDVRIHR